jgi:hypothetical protein
LLQSEKRRIIWVTAFLGPFAVLISIRILVFGSPISHWSIAVVVLFALYELLMLRTLDRLSRAGRDLPAAI